MVGFYKAFYCGCLSPVSLGELFLWASSTIVVKINYSEGTAGEVSGLPFLVRFLATQKMNMKQNLF